MDSQDAFNQQVESEIMGPLTRKEIRALPDLGYAFKARTLDTEASLAALEALARAPREVAGAQALAMGRLEALQALAAREDEGLEWHEGFEEGAALARDAASARHARALSSLRKEVWEG